MAGLKSLKFKSGLGVNKDIPANELPPGVWSDMLNMRSINGVDEIVGGIASAFTTPTMVPYWLNLYQTSTARYLVEVGLAAAYVDDGTTRTKVTPQVGAVGILSIAYATSGANTIFTVTTRTAHGLTTGNSVTVSSVYVNFAGTYTITVTGASTFTYTRLGFNFYGGGSGVDADPSPSYTLSGAADSGFTATVDDRFTGGSLNGVLMLNSPKDGLYYWLGDPSVRMYRQLSADGVTPLAFLADVARPFKNFAVQLATTESGVKYPWRVRWSGATDPGTVPSVWTPAATNLAGFVDLAAGGQLVDCLPMGDLNIIYATDARYAMQYLPGDTADVFSFTRLPGNDGLLARGCIASTPVGHVFLTPSKDVKVHNGADSKSLAEGRIKRWLQTNMDATYAARSFIAANPYKSEVWVCFPESGQSTCTKAAVWNWDSDTWSIRSLPNMTCAETGLVPTAIATERRMIVGTTTPKIGNVDSGSTDFGATITGTLERQGIDGDNPDTVKVLNASKWLGVPTGSVLSIQHGSAMTPDTAPTYATAVTYTVGTDNKAMRETNGGRQLAVKLQTSSAGFKCRSAELEFAEGGEW